MNKRSILILLFLMALLLTSCNSQQISVEKVENKFKANINSLQGTYGYKSLGREYYQIIKNGEKFIIIYAWLASNTYNQFMKTEVDSKNIIVDVANNNINFSADFNYNAKYFDGRTEPRSEKSNFILNIDGLSVNDGKTTEIFNKENFDYDLETIYNAKEASDQYMVNVYKKNSSIKSFGYNDDFYYAKENEIWFYYRIKYDASDTVNEYDSFEKIGHTITNIFFGNNYSVDSFVF